MNLVFTSSVWVSMISEPSLHHALTKQLRRKETHLLLADHTNLAASALPLEGLDSVPELVADRPVLVYEVLQLLVVPLDRRIVCGVH